jgi:P27 family predicted phage terminase small subunit
MGARGFPPKPTALKRLEGNPGKRRLNTREPQPLPGEPEMPEGLDDIARKEWERLVPVLLRMRVLTEADQMALANLCRAYSTMIQAEEQMRLQAIPGKSPLVKKLQRGFGYQTILLRIINTQMDIVNRQLREFGLTPASRSRIVVNAGNPVNPVEVKLCG